MAGSREASKIYFIRHGECRANTVDMSLPPDEDLLTERGQQQAKLLGKHLASVRFTSAYTSTFARARETAECIMDELPCPKPCLEEDSRLRERDMGEFENRPVFDLWHAAFADVKQNGTLLLDYEIPGGEPVQELEQRMAFFLEDLFEKIRESDKTETIFVVSHGILLMRMMLMLRRWKDEPQRQLSLSGWSLGDFLKQVKNTGYHLLSVEAPINEKLVKVSIEKINEAGHLEEFNKNSVPKKPSQEFIGIVGTFNEIVGQQCTTH